MSSLPQLPFGLTYAASGVFLLALITAVFQQFFADELKAFLRGVRRRAASRRRAIRHDEWARYAAWVARKYKTTKLGFMQNLPITLDAVYVPLQYEQDGLRVDIYRDIQSHLRTMVVGAAGAGKSTVLRHSMLQWAAAPQRFDRVPVLVELGRYNLGGRTIQQLVIETFALVQDTGVARRGRKKPPARPLVDDAEQIVPEALAVGRLCVFLDGLDEVVTDRRGDAALEIKEFAERYAACQIVVTCRDAVYDNDLSPTFDRKITVAGLDDAGIRRFLGLWFKRPSESVGEGEPGGAIGDVVPDPREQVEQLMAELRANPTLMWLARSPLMLTIIALLHDVDPGAGPMLTNSRAEFYEQAVTHLLRRDPALGRYRQLSRYRFAHKLMALRAIALAAQGDLTPGSDHRVITQDEINAVMSRLRPRFQLPETDLPKIINEIVERSGLLISIDDANLVYEFAHPTLQEYLAAVELAAEPDRLLALYRENPSRWRETVKLWCAAANRDATDLVQQIFAGDARDRLLALECVAEARQIDTALATRIVDEFAAQLGADILDKRLVLAALGSVAGNPGSIGHELFVRLRGQAMKSGPIGADAVVALADSRRRPAIETLSELALRESAARAALRSTGELAIPVLASRAHAGSVTAVDDLAAIGTPAAAVAIAEQMWGQHSVAIRAAWQLAALICAPDVESELTRFDPAPFERGSTEWHEWLWAPFVPRSAARIGMAVTMGRVGWLIDQSAAADVPPGLGTVDARLALGLGTRQQLFTYRDITNELHRQFSQASERVGLSWRILNDAEVAETLDGVEAVDPDDARNLAEGVVLARAKDWPSPLLLRRLPTPLLVQLAKRLWRPDGFDVDIRDWLALNDQPEQPKVLSRIRIATIRIAVALVFAAVGIALTRSVCTLIGWWAWGPRWFAVLVLLSFVVAVVALAIDGYVTPGSEVFQIVGVFSSFVSAVPILIVALRTTVGWLGWFATIAIVVVTAAAVSIFSIWTSRRERAIRNPYRAILQHDRRIAQPSATVIARGIVGPASPQPSTKPAQLAR